MENMGTGGAELVMASAVALVSTWGLRVLGAAVLLIVGWVVSRMVRGAVRRALTRAHIDAALIPFVSSLVYYLLLTFVVVAVLSLFGIQTTSFIAVLGAAGFAVGLAMQGTLSNFASGVMLLIFRPFTVGDYVDSGGTAGTVQEIGIFSTVLHTPDNVKVTVPNSSIYGTIIKNYSANDKRRIDLVVGVSYEDDLGRAIEVVRSVIGADDRILGEPEPQVAVSELGDSSVNLVVRPWCRTTDYWAVRFDLTRRIKEQLEAAGCSIPFPQRDVHVRQVAS